MSNELLDWKGNPISHGDTFCIIRVSPLYRLKFTGLMWLHGGWENKIIPNPQYWEPGPYYEVRSGYFTYERHDDTITSSLSVFKTELYKDDRYIIALRDISDKKEIYYDTTTVQRKVSTI